MVGLFFCVFVVLGQFYRKGRHSRGTPLRASRSIPAPPTVWLVHYVNGQPAGPSPYTRPGVDKPPGVPSLPFSKVFDSANCFYTAPFCGRLVTFLRKIGDYFAEGPFFLRQPSAHKTVWSALYPIMIAEGKLSKNQPSAVRERLNKKTGNIRSSKRTVVGDPRE